MKKWLLTAAIAASFTAQADEGMWQPHQLPAMADMLKEKGLHIPNDIAVIGYDNTPHARWMSPSITTIHQSINFMGKQSFNLLNKLIHGIELDTFHDIIDVYLVERDTA